MGMRRTLYRWEYVGTKGHPPFKVTHGAHSFYLLNVKSTRDKHILYAPHPAQEDIDFNFACEEASLVVLKCNTLFFAKNNLQPAKPRPGAIPFSLGLHIQQSPDQVVNIFGGQPIRLHIARPAHMQSWQEAQLKEQLTPATFQLTSGGNASSMPAQWLGLQADGGMILSVPAVCPADALHGSLQEALLCAQQGHLSPAGMTIPGHAEAELQMGAFGGSFVITMDCFYVWSINSGAESSLQMAARASADAAPCQASVA